MASLERSDWHEWARSDRNRAASRRFREKKAGQRKVRARQKGLWIKKARTWQ